jgi:hypothetical protein
MGTEDDAFEVEVVPPVFAFEEDVVVDAFEVEVVPPVFFCATFFFFFGCSFAVSSSSSSEEDLYLLDVPLLKRLGLELVGDSDSWSEPDSDSEDSKSKFSPWGHERGELSLVSFCK